MSYQSHLSNSFFRVGTTGEKLINPNVNQYRLNNEQRAFYTKLFNQNASDGKVKRENFLPLLGIFGTKIAQDFSDRMFLVLSKGKQEISLEEYLNYIDTYHYGDIHERCLYTCKLMDTNQKGKIELEDFKSYINLIINTVKRVNNTLAKKDLMSDKDIEYLFYHISKGKNFFSYSDFENIYQEKPELVSWFDYFKNDKEDILLILHQYIPNVLKVFNEFLCNFMNDLFLVFDKEKEINLELIFQEVLNYSDKLERIMNIFIKKLSKFTITNAFTNIKNQNYNKSNLIYDLQNKIFETNIHGQNLKKGDDIKNNNNIDDFFNEIKKSLYQKDEKEIVLENQNIKLPKYKNDSKCICEKLKKSSTIFGFKNFKFFNNNNQIQTKNNQIKRNYLSPNNFNGNRAYLDKKIMINNDINNMKNKVNNIPKNNYLINRNINNINNYNIYNYNSEQNLYILGNNLNYNNKNNYLNDFSVNNDTYKNRYDLQITNPNINLKKNYEYSLIPEENFCALKESQKIKQLLFCSRVIIERALEINSIFNNCYRWISENYLSKYISKKIKDERLKEKKKFKIKNSKLNIPRKLVPVKKKIIGASDKSFEILFNMIMGIQIAVQAVPNFRINDKEEIKKYLTKMIYSIQTIYLGKEMEESYILKEFGGVIFNNIRLYLGINKDEFIKSISPQDFITELMISSQTLFEELCSTGSSGSLLYYTRDGEFIVKTISKKEYKFLKKMIAEYFFYLKENPLTFLPKLLGCYILKRKIKKKVTSIYFIVLNNVFSNDHHIDLRFDLKGSTIGRRVLTGTTNDSKVFMSGDMALKDLDFNKINERVNIGQKRQIVLTQLKKDIEYLYRINSNDYSLLLGIHCIKDSEKFNLSTETIKTTEYKKDELSFLSKNTLYSNSLDTESNKSTEKSAVDRINKLKAIYDFEDGGILSQNKKRIYYFGIIDILTEFNSIKNLEYYYKKLRYCSENMSCVPPILYKERFFNYLNVVFHDEPQNFLEIDQTQTQRILDIKSNNDFIKKPHINVDKYGAISSSKYEEYQKEDDKFADIGDNSLHKF